MANSGKMTLGRTPHFSAVEKVPAFIDKGPYFFTRTEGRSTLSTSVVPYCPGPGRGDLGLLVL